MINYISKLNLYRLTAICSLIGAASAASPAALASNFLTGHSAYTVSAPIAAQTAQTYTVELNKTEVVQLPAPASAVIIGNPEIADISIHSSRTIFVIGRSYGETNLTILDTNGRKIMDADIQVSNKAARNGVRVFFGGTERQSYHCSPYCAAAPVLGDTPAFIGANSAGGTAINNTIALGSSGGGGGAGLGGANISGGGGAAASIPSGADVSSVSSFGS